MTDNHVEDSNLAEEFRNLGKNLVGATRAAWDSPQRQKLQQEIESGLQDVRDAIRKEAENWGESTTAQRLREDVENVSERVRSSDIENTLRRELLAALHNVNQELEKLTERWVPGEQGGSVPPASDEGQDADLGGHE